MSVSISIRLPDNIANELDIISKETERSKSFHIQKAVEIYLAERADFQIALDRLNDHTDPIISMDEMRANLGL
jgi:RHH-type rel operon transcriptional repressor/antitoxin RelB